jgi:hypothetical protein
MLRQLGIRNRLHTLPTHATALAACQTLFNYTPPVAIVCLLHRDHARHPTYPYNTMQQYELERIASPKLRRSVLMTFLQNQPIAISYESLFEYDDAFLTGGNCYSVPYLAHWWYLGSNKRPLTLLYSCPLFIKPSVV